jgi:hypothetical protein
VVVATPKTLENRPVSSKRQQQVTCVLSLIIQRCNLQWLAIWQMLSKSRLASLSLDCCGDDFHSCFVLRGEKLWLAGGGGNNDMSVTLVLVVGLLFGRARLIYHVHTPSLRPSRMA